VIGGSSGFVGQTLQHPAIDTINKQLILSSIGYGAAEAFLDVGAIVTIISSSADRVQAAVKRLNSPNVQGLVGDVRNEGAFVEVLLSLAPVDHIVFSGVDKIIRGKLQDMDFNEAKHLFGVKFWGAALYVKKSCVSVLRL